MDKENTDFGANIKKMENMGFLYCNRALILL